jgi:hypothetical protein
MAFIISLARRFLAPHEVPTPVHHAPVEAPARPASPTAASWILHSR